MDGFYNIAQTTSTTDALFGTIEVLLIWHPITNDAEMGNIVISTLIYYL